MEEITPGELAILQALDALLEAQMRTYDAQLAVLKAIEGSREGVDALRAQHAQGIMYFPPFAIANINMETEDDQTGVVPTPDAGDAAGDS